MSLGGLFKNTDSLAYMVDKSNLVLELMLRFDHSQNFWGKEVILTKLDYN